MAQLSAKQVQSAYPFPNDLKILQRDGLQPAKLGGMYQLLSMTIDKVFRGKISDELLVGIKERLNDSMMKYFEHKPTLLYFIDERNFGDFCGMASHTTHQEANFKEKTLDIRCIFTTDAELTRDKIPRVTKMTEFAKIRKGKGVPYKDNHVYVFNTLTEEVLGNESTTFTEYLFYIPRSYMRCY